MVAHGETPPSETRRTVLAVAGVGRTDDPKGDDGLAGRSQLESSDVEDTPLPEEAGCLGIGAELDPLRARWSGVLVRPTRDAVHVNPGIPGHGAMAT